MPSNKSRAWWGLPTSYKDLLQQKRQEGYFGGAEAAGAKRAPYFWGQEFGNPAADITAQNFIGDTLPNFYPEFVRIMTQGVTNA